MLSVMHVLNSLMLGGAERLTVELAKAQVNQSLNVKIYSLGSDSEFLVSEVKNAGIALESRKPGSSRLDGYKQVLAAMEPYDVVHIHSPRSLAHLTPILPFLGNKKIVYTRHGIDPLNSLKWKLIHRLWSRYINVATFVTQAGYDVFENVQRWDRDKLKVITNGVVIPENQGKSIPTSLRFGSVGRMVGLKRQDIFLEAAKLLKESPSKPDFSVHFFGAGPEQAALEKMVQDLELQNVKFHGEVKDVDAIYSNIDVLVVSSESEGLSMVIIEAMAREIPTIATDVGGNPTLVTSGETGVLIPFGSAKVLFEAMEMFVKDPNLILSLGSNAKSHVQANYSLEKTCEQYISCYQSL